MAIGIYFAPAAMSAAQYDDVTAKLEAAGQGAPAGRLNHFGLVTDGGIAVFDVWESRESFDAFGETLMPILAAAGVDPGEPMVSEIHNTITG